MGGKTDRYISSNTYKALLARSGNKCAFPNCTHPIINEQNRLIAQLCHIEAAAEGGERFNPDLTPEQINNYDNLLFMCYKHHVETDDVAVFSVEKLKKIKYDHESKYIQNPYQIDMSHIYLLKKESEDYWLKVENANNTEHIVPNLKISIDTKATYEELNKELIETIDKLDSLINVIDQDDKDKYWDIFNLGLRNHFSKVRVLLDQMTIKYLDTYILINPYDIETSSKLENLRNAFLEMSKRIGHAD